MRLPAVLLLLVCTQAHALDQDAGYRLAVGDLTTGEPVPGYVFDITVQNVEQLDAILNRADKLRVQFNPKDYGRIALVLHGQELQLFRKSNYQKNMTIVEKARRLDQQHLIDIKACQTSMTSQHIEQSELPDFIEQVPFAPLEIERLETGKGYTRL